MHELALTEHILQTAVPEAQKHGAAKILEIRLKIGELSGVLPGYLQRCFEVVREDTIASEARLVIETVPVSIRCRACGYEGSVDRKNICCPDCGGTDFTITAGREFCVDSLVAE